MPDSDRLSHYVGVVATAWEGSFGRDAVRLVEGRDTDAVVLGTTAVFRFPKHPTALAALPREVAALTALHTDAGTTDLLPTVLVDCSRAELGTAFVAQRFLDGEPLTRASFDAVGPIAYRFAAEIARVLDALAAAPTEDLPLTRAPMHRTFAELAERCPPEAAAAFDDVLSLDAAEPVLVHGDLTANALRWDADDTRLTGVLGWS